MEKQTLRVEKVSTRMRGLLAPISLLVGMLLATESNAQIETMYNMYRFNPQILSPVQAGSTQHSEVIFLHRNQWQEIKGAPITFSLTGNIKWGDKKGIGVGAMVDQAGPMTTTIVSGDFAYHTKLSDKWTLSGGIRVSAANVFLDFEGLLLTNRNDPLFQGNRSTGIQPNAGFGIRFNKGDGLFASFSMPRLGKYNFGQYNGAFKDVNYLYANVGTRIKLGGEITTKQGDVVSRVTLYPSLMARVAVDVPISWDANLQANLKGKLDLGVSYRREDSWGFRAGVQATKKYYLTYVFEKPISELAKVTTATHEFGIRMFIFKSDKKRDNRDEKLETRNEILETRGNVEVSTPRQAERPTTGTSEQIKPTEQKVSEPEKQKTVTPIVNPETSVAPARTSQNNTATPSVSSTQSAVQTPLAAQATDDEEWEYVTVTKTRVVRKRPVKKVVAKETRDQKRETNNLKQAPKSSVKSVKSAVQRSVSKPSSASSTEVKKQAVDPNAPKISRKRISSNVTETTVETKGGSEAQAGQASNQKVSKRKRKDGTEETVYTTTEVVRKKKEK